MVNRTLGTERHNNQSRAELIMTNDILLKDASYIEAGRSAVRLLNILAGMVPLRSDTAQMRDEISRIEGVFSLNHSKKS